MTLRADLRNIRGTENGLLRGIQEPKRFNRLVKATVKFRTKADMWSIPGYEALTGVVRPAPGELVHAWKWGKVRPGDVVLYVQYENSEGAAVWMPVNWARPGVTKAGVLADLAGYWAARGYPAKLVVAGDREEAKLRVAQLPSRLEPEHLQIHLDI